MVVTGHVTGRVGKLSELAVAAELCRIQRSRRWKLAPLPREKWGRDISSPVSAFLCAFGLTNPEESNNERIRDRGVRISGGAKLDLEGQTLILKRGDSWLVPAGAMHQYTVIEPFTAVEATAPPAEVHVAMRPTEPRHADADWAVRFGRNSLPAMMV